MTSLRGKLYQTLSLAYYYVFVAPLGRGMHRTPKSWDAQYRSGYWEIFRTTAEMPRYAIIASHIRRWKSDPKSSGLCTICMSGPERDFAGFRLGVVTPRMWSP